MINFEKIKIIYYFLYYYNLKFKSKSNLRKYQKAKLSKFLKKIKKKSKYYKNYLEKNKTYNWSKKPTISKTEWMENFDTINTVSLNKKDSFEIAINSELSRDFKSKINNITVGLSSGTSGNRGLFLVSDDERSKWCGYIIAKLIPDMIIKDMILKNKKIKIAFFLRANSNLYETANTSKIIFKYFDLILDIDENLKSLNEFMPDVLIAPASVLKNISKAKLVSKINNVNPRKIISVAEVLDKIDEVFIAKTFSLERVHQVYQCTEGLLGYTCSHGNIHLAEENLIIEKEFISKTKFYPIITDFNRESQPIIKYKLNDILTLKHGKCACGWVSTVIKSIDGRADDIFILKSKDKLNYVDIYPDFISRAIMYSSKHITDYKATQSSKIDNFEITVYVKYENIQFGLLKTKIISQLNKMFDKLNVITPNIYVIEGLPEPEKGKKYKRIEKIK